MAGSAGAIRAGSAYVSLFTDASKMDAGLKAAIAKMKAFGASVQAVGMQMAQVGVGMGIPLALSAKHFADFDDQMRTVRAVTELTTEEFERLTAKAKLLGSTTSFSAVEVAQLMTELGKAGFKGKQIEDATASVLDLARATGTDATLSSKIMVTTLRQFGLEASESARVANVLAAAANGSLSSVESLGETMSYTALVAKDFNASLEDTAAMSAVLSNLGIEGSMAGTALRRLFVITGAEAKKVGQIFGTTLTDSNDNALPLMQILTEIGEKTKGLGTAAKSAKFNEAFGLLGITGAKGLSGSGMEFKEMQALIKQGVDTNRVAAAAKMMDAGLGGAIRKTITAIKAVALEIGEALAPALQLLGFGLQAAKGAIIEWVKENRGLVAISGAAVIALIGLGGALIGLGIAIKVAAFAMGTFVAIVGLVKLPVTLLYATVGAFQAMNAATMAVVVSIKALGAAFLASTLFARLHTAAMLAGAAASTLFGAAVSVVGGVLKLFRAALVGTFVAAKAMSVAFFVSGAAVRLWGVALLGASAIARAAKAVWLGLAAVGSLTSAAMVGVSAALGLVVGGITALLSPIVLIVGAIGVIGYAFIAASKEGTRARDAMGEAWTGIKDAAVSAWTGISEAIADGEMGMAMKIAGKGLQAIWASAIAGLEVAWIEFTGFLETALFNVGGSLVSIFHNVVAGMKSIWLEFSALLSKPSNWGMEYNKGLLRMLGDPADDTERQAKFRKHLQEQIAMGEQEQKGHKDETEKKRAEIGKELIEKEEEIKQKKKVFAEGVEARNKGKVAKAMAGVGDDQKELDQLVAEAKEKREGKAALARLGGLVKLGGFGGLAARIAAGKDEIDKDIPLLGLDQGPKTKGTFSGAAASMFGNEGGGLIEVQKQQLAEIKKQAAAAALQKALLERIARGVEAGGIVMA